MTPGGVHTPSGIKLSTTDSSVGPPVPASKDPGRQSYLPGDRHHGVLEKRRHPRKRRRHGEPRLPAPRSSTIAGPRGEPRRGGADFDLAFDGSRSAGSRRHGKEEIQNVAFGRPTKGERTLSQRM